MAIGYSPKFPLSFSQEGGYTLNESIVDVVKQNFKNLLLTNPGERIFDLNFGVGLKRFLFEQKVEETNQSIKNRVYSQVKEYMPFIDISSINISNVENSDNEIYIVIQYYIPNISVFDSIELSVDT